MREKKEPAFDSSFWERKRALLTVKDGRNLVRIGLSVFVREVSVIRRH